MTLYTAEAGPLTVALLQRGEERRVRVWNTGIPSLGLVVSVDAVGPLVKALGAAEREAKRADRT